MEHRVRYLISFGSINFTRRLDVIIICEISFQKFLKQTKTSKADTRTCREIRLPLVVYL